jgi:hypothetical protein
MDGATAFSASSKNGMSRRDFGSIRLSPHAVGGELIWFMTATSDGLCRSGVPLAVPEEILGRYGLDSAPRYDVVGQMRAIPDVLNQYLLLILYSVLYTKRR